MDANFIGANLGQVDLCDANLTGAFLTVANLRDAEINGAALTEATVGWTTFAAVDLSAVNGLETVKYKGPSTLGIDTLYKSHGETPEVFLRGAGVPDTFISYIGSLVGRPIEFYSFFISYSSKDQGFAEAYMRIAEQGGSLLVRARGFKERRPLPGAHRRIDSAP